MEQLSEKLAAHYNDLYDIAFKITKGNDLDAQDLTQEVYIIILEYDTDKMTTIYNNGHLKFWAARVMLNQYLRGNSAFKKKHHTIGKSEFKDVEGFAFDYDGIPDKIEFERKLNCINEAMKDLHFYDRTLFKVYYETNHSIRSLAEATGISTTSIFHTIKNVRNYIKDEIKDKQ